MRRRAWERQNVALGLCRHCGRPPFAETVAPPHPWTKRSAKDKAVAQARAERRTREGYAWCLRQSGLPLADIGEVFGITAEGARQLVVKAERRIAAAVGVKSGKLPDASGVCSDSRRGQGSD